MRPLSASDVEALDILALRTDPAEGIPFIAGVLSCPSFTLQQMEEAWQAYQEAVRWRDALTNGIRDWSEKYKEADLPAGGTPSEAALELARTVADEARNHLMNGGPR